MTPVRLVTTIFGISLAVLPVWRAGELKAESRDTAPLALIAERSTPDGIHHFGLVFHADRVEMTRNSNFLDEPGTDALLGHFKAVPGTRLEERRKVIAHLRERLARRAEFIGRIAPGLPAPSRALKVHEARFRVGDHEVETGSPEWDEIQSIPTYIFRAADWKAVDGVKVSRIGKGRIRIEYLGKSASRRKSAEFEIAKAGPCKPVRAGGYLCEIAPFGFVAVTPSD